MKIDVLQRLVAASDALLDCLTTIRYSTWPAGFHPVEVYAMDEVLIESDQAIRHAKRFIKTETSDKEKLKRQALAKLTDEERKALGFGG